MSNDRITTPYLFVYGSLRSLPGDRLHPLLKPLAQLVEPAHCYGRLYQVHADYPGLVLGGDPQQRVVGEVYRLQAPALALAQLDDYEGCSPRYREPTEFKRVRESVTLQSGQNISAWLYIYQWQINNQTQIASGDYLQGE